MKQSGGHAMSYRVVREVLSDEVTLSRDRKEAKGGSHADNREQRMPNSGISEYQASEQECSWRNIGEGYWG